MALNVNEELEGYGGGLIDVLSQNIWRDCGIS
jgi:hypothetical protein